MNEVQGPTIFFNADVHTNVTIKQKSVELMGLYHIPLSKTWDFYTKIGVAYLLGDLHTDSRYSGVPPFVPPDMPKNLIQNKKVAALNPAYGFGIGRNFLDGRFFLGADWNKVAAWGGRYNDYFNSVLQSSSMFTINAIYRFAPYTSVSSDSAIWETKSNSKFYVGAFTGGIFGAVSYNEGTELQKGIFASILNIGYMFSSHVGIELDNVNIPPNNENDKTSNTQGLMLKFTAPINKDFSVLVKVGGVGNLGLGYDFGVGYSLTQHLQVNTQYLSFNNIPVYFAANVQSRSNIIGAGINYNF